MAKVITTLKDKKGEDTIKIGDSGMTVTLTQYPEKFQNYNARVEIEYDIENVSHWLTMLPELLVYTTQQTPKEYQIVQKAIYQWVERCADANNIPGAGIIIEVKDNNGKL
jgi:hypothetical protein